MTIVSVEGASTAAPSPCAARARAIATWTAVGAGGALRHRRRDDRQRRGRQYGGAQSLRGPCEEQLP
ncbi:hypothetical protein, partial [Streptomyces sp. MBT65]|uniref:hypothetical protein n=1 Tax=Streptomyces sp. MBT65 TaxID=1488395 RepID=UPI001F1BB197